MIKRSVSKVFWGIYRAVVDRGLSAISSPGAAEGVGKFLVDSAWDNANYWFRFAFLRMALGLKPENGTGLLGKYNAPSCKRTLRRYGVKRTLNWDNLPFDDSKVEEMTTSVLDRVGEAGDLLEIELPHGFPNQTFYDYVLKRQRSSKVLVDREDFHVFVKEGFTYIEKARKLFEDEEFKVTLLSHANGLPYGALGFWAIRNGVLCIALKGKYGVLQFLRLDSPEVMKSPNAKFDRATFDAIFESPSKTDLLREGEAYLNLRFNGGGDDIGGRNAYRKSSKEGIDRTSVCAKFQWDPGKPIVAVYASNWFDYPHSHGMKNFRDFEDWITTIIDTARNVRDVNWLFKPHPTEKWYGGVKLRNEVGRILSGNLGLANEDWLSYDLIGAVDALITYHGTSGIEYASLGKPVLVSDVGYYYDLGFVLAPESRSDFIRLLGEKWWEQGHPECAAERAKVFAGLYFGRPKWQEEMVVPCDSRKEGNYRWHLPLVLKNRGAVLAEVRELREWIASGERSYHVFKMRRAEAYTTRVQY